jgi:hypothetical protein
MNNKEKLIMFMTIGDGHLEKKNLQIIHSEKQLSYLEWKKSLLVDSGIECGNTKLRINNRNPKPQYLIQSPSNAFYFRTKSYEWIKELRSILYPVKSKSISAKVLGELDPLGLAIWYMDDGGLSQKKQDGKIMANDLMINTGLQKSENQIIIDYFKSSWDISFSQVKNHNCYRLRCGTKEARKFVDIIYPYVSQIPDMHYKINIKNYSFLNSERK